MRCTTQRWTTAAGNAAVTALAKPASPSTQAMRTSRTPRLRRSAVTLPQKRAPSPAVALSGGVRASQIPSTCFSPSASTPIAT